MVTSAVNGSETPWAGNGVTEKKREESLGIDTKITRKEKAKGWVRDVFHYGCRVFSLISCIQDSLPLYSIACNIIRRTELRGREQKFGQRLCFPSWFFTLSIENNKDGGHSYPYPLVVQNHILWSESVRDVMRACLLILTHWCVTYDLFTDTAIYLPAISQPFKGNQPCRPFLSISVFFRLSRVDRVSHFPHWFWRIL